MISHDLQCVFIHIPKCAGTSIETGLGLPNRDDVGIEVHHTLREVEPMSLCRAVRVAFSSYPHCDRLAHARRFASRRIGSPWRLTRDQYQSYFKFTFIRNPWARVYSYYKFAIRDNLRPARVLGPEVSLERLLKRYMGQGALRSQLFWLYDSRRQIPLDFIGRFERLADDFQIVAQKLGVDDAQLPHKLASNNPSYVDNYTDTARQIVADAYREEIEYFGYRFGD